MILDRFSNLNNMEHSLSDGVRFVGFDNVCENILNKSVRADGDITQIYAVVGIPEEIRKKAEKLSGERFTESPDAYVIEVDDKVSVYGASNRALLYAAHNIAARDTFGEGLVYNYPSESFRMVKLYLPSEENIPFFKELIDLLCHYGFNTLMIETGGAMEYKSHPEINEGWLEYAKIASDNINKRGDNPHFPYKDGETYFLKNSIHCENADGGILAQEKIKELIDYCRRRYIEIIPEVPSLSHSDYLLTRHPELAERTEDLYPDSYCPSNEESYKLLFDILDETIELFKPVRINIGHDEFYSIGLCDKCKTKDPAQLYAEDIKKIHTFLKSRGVGTLMWSDKLLNTIDKKGVHWGGAERVITHPETGEYMHTVPATHKAIDMVPNDVELLHWYWAMGKQAEKEFMKRGFTVHFANFEPYTADDIKSRLADGICGMGISNWSKVDQLHVQRNGIYFDVALAAMLMWQNDFDEDKTDENIAMASKGLLEYRCKGYKYRADIVHTVKEGRDYELFLDGYEVNSGENVLGEYIVDFTDGSQIKIPAEYGRTVGYAWVKRERTDSDWRVCYATDRRLAEPMFSAALEFEGNKTWYRFAVVANKEISKVSVKADGVEVKEIKYYG